MVQSGSITKDMQSVDESHRKINPIKITTATDLKAQYKLKAKNTVAIRVVKEQNQHGYR